MDKGKGSLSSFDWQALDPHAGESNEAASARSELK